MGESRAKITQYSVGFLHNDWELALITKNRPEWQAGKLNGIGGHIELGETPHECMVREFQEETGVLVPKWDHFLTLKGPLAEIYVFGANDNGEFMDRLETMTDEKVGLHAFDNLNKGYGYHTVPNLKWIVPLLRQRANYKPIEVNFYGDS